MSIERVTRCDQCGTTVEGYDPPDDWFQIKAAPMQKATLWTMDLCPRCWNGLADHFDLGPARRGLNLEAG